MTTTRRFEMDAAAEIATGRLRLVAAAITLGAAIWLAASDPGPLGWAVMVFGLIAVLGWALAFRKSRKRAAEADAHYLLLDAAGLTLAEGDRRHHVGWKEMTEVEIDEDRLVVRIHYAEGAALVIQPRFRDLSLEGLGSAVEEARVAALGPTVVK